MPRKYYAKKPTSSTLNSINPNTWITLDNIPKDELKRMAREARQEAKYRYYKLSQKYDYTPALHSWEQNYRRLSRKYISKHASTKTLTDIIRGYHKLYNLKTATIEGAEQFKRVFEDEYRELQSMPEDTRKDFFDAYQKLVEEDGIAARFKYEIWREIYNEQVIKGVRGASLFNHLRDVLDDLLSKDVTFEDDENPFIM